MQYKQKTAEIIIADYLVLETSFVKMLSTVFAIKRSAETVQPIVSFFIFMIDGLN